jgi:hypothetical protein
LVCAAPVCAQLSDRLTRCLPYPTYSQEVRAMHAEIDAKIAALYPAHADSDDFPPVVFDKITVDADSQLPPGDRQRLVEMLSGLPGHADPGWLDEIQRAYVAGFLQDRGYFRSDPRVTSETLRTDGAGEHVALTVFANEGPQFRMGRLAFRSSDPEIPMAFTRDELESRFYLREGDIFAASKIRDTLNALKKLYESQGYIDFVATPITEIHELTGKIDVTLEVDQQKQFRIDKVVVDTASPEVHAAAATALAPGSVFNLDEVTKFLKDNTALLPPDMSLDDVELRRNVKAGTVDITLHLAPCPQLDN